MTTSLEGISFGTTLHVELWEDPVGDAIGVDPRSDYVERFWLPFLGPSTTWLVRHLSWQLERRPGGFDLDLDDCARALGIGGHDTARGPMLRSLARALDYRVLRRIGPLRFACRARLHLLSPGLVARLPAELVARHDHYLREAEAAIGGDALAERGHRLALSLVALGECTAEVERQLLRWRFDPLLARRCARWAARHHAAAAPPPAAATAPHRSSRESPVS